MTKKPNDNKRKTISGTTMEVNSVSKSFSIKTIKEHLGQAIGVLLAQSHITGTLHLVEDDCIVLRDSRLIEVAGDCIGKDQFITGDISILFEHIEIIHQSEDIILRDQKIIEEYKRCPQRRLINRQY